MVSVLTERSLYVLAVAQAADKVGIRFFFYLVQKRCGGVVERTKRGKNGDRFASGSGSG